MIKCVPLFKRPLHTQKSTEFHNTNNNIETEMAKVGVKPLKCVEILNLVTWYPKL